jgi:hypothetical protein
MSFDPKDAIDSARDIAKQSIEKAAEIVDNASEILKGNVAEGTANIVQNSLAIATGALQKAKEALTGLTGDHGAAAGGDSAPADDA